MPDFDFQLIEIRDGTDLWGPFTFPFATMIPSGDTIQSVDVKALIGKMDKSNNIADYTDIADDLIDSAVVSGNTVVVKFQHPGDTYEGNKITLVFIVTLSSGAIYPFYFHLIKVY